MSIGLVDFANNQTMAVSLHACALGGHLTRCYTTGHKHKYVGQVCGLRVQERAMEYLLGLAWSREKGRKQIVIGQGGGRN